MGNIPRNIMMNQLMAIKSCSDKSILYSVWACGLFFWYPKTVRFAPKIGPSGLSQNLKHAHMESVTFKQSGLWVQTWTIDIMVLLISVLTHLWAKI